MQKSTASPMRQRMARLVEHPRFLSLAVGLVAIATAVGGISCLIGHGCALDVEYVLAPAGVTLLTMSLAQFRVSWIAWPKPKALSSANSQKGWGFVRLLVFGSLVGYIACLAIGPIPYIECAWLTTLVVWYTLLIMPLAASPKTIEGWRQWLQGHTPRRLNWLVAASVLLVIGAESGFQIQNMLRRQAWLWSASAPNQASANLFFPVSNRQISEVAERLSSVLFRVVVLGDDVVGRGAGQNDYLLRIEQMLPGVEIVPLNIQDPWSSGLSPNLADRLSHARPDLVLSVVSACKDLAHAPMPTSWFDWRQFELARQFGWAADNDLRANPSEPSDFESLLGDLSAQLAVCSTPMDDQMRARWQQTFAALDTLAAVCARHRFPLAVVAVPGEFQVNSALCETLSRRLGYSPAQLDMELPQRKLACFAESRKLPLVDLLPSLRLCRQSPYERNTAVWNEQGNSAAAAAIGGWLESRYGGQLTVARLSKVR